MMTAAKRMLVALFAAVALMGAPACGGDDGGESPGQMEDGGNGHEDHED